MLTEPISAARMDDCLSMVLSCGPLDVGRRDIKKITRQSGGLFNFLLKIETTKGNIYFKQYLDGEPNEIYSPPAIPANTRSMLAYKVHEISFTATVGLGNVVPKILQYDHEKCALLMTEAAGRSPLITLLAKGEIPESVLTVLPSILAELHTETNGRFGEDSIYDNSIFRDFKLDLQYDGIVKYLTKQEEKLVLDCKEQYRSRKLCVTHGDINSRNILVGENCLSVIDFEQSHLGAPAYDISYILCEILISVISHGHISDLKIIVSKFLDSYFESSASVDRLNVETEITQHLAIQTMYRFWGPSHLSWTFFVNEDRKGLIIEYCRKLLRAYGPITQMLK